MASEFCLKLINRYLLKAGHFLGDTCGHRGHLWPQGHNINKLGRSPVDDVTYQTLMLWALQF